METLTGTTILGQIRPENNGNEGVLHSLQSYSLTNGCSLVSYSGHFFGEGFTSLQGIE